MARSFEPGRVFRANDPSSAGMLFGLPIMTQPFVMHWAGWRSTTLDLQRQGWEWSIYEDKAMMAMRFVAHCPSLRLLGMTTEFCFHEMQQHGVPELTLTQVAHDERFIVDERLDLKPVEMLPAANAIITHGMADWEHARYSLLDALPMRQVPEAEQVIIDEANMDVVEMLQSILEEQAPRQQEIRERRRREDVVTETRLEVVA